MIVIELSGDIEEQMFQWALYVRLKNIHTEDVLFYSMSQNNSSSLENAFQLQIPRVTEEQKILFFPTTWNDKMKVQLQRFTKGKSYKILEERRSFCFDPKILEPFEEHIYLQGKWQSYKYISEILPQLRKDFTTEKLSEPAKKIRKEILRKKPICIHLSSIQALEEDSKTVSCCSKSFYFKALDYFLSKNPRSEIWVFSDTENFNAEQILGKKPTKTITINDWTFNEKIETFKTSTQFVLSNSLVSWWGAILCSEVSAKHIVPFNWFPYQGAYFPDFIPEQWLAFE